MANKTHFPRAGGNQWVQSFYQALFPDVGITGNVWYVNSAAGTDSSGYGYSPEAPLASIAYAVATAAVADNNDVVVVLPGHTETITAAAGVNMSKAGVTVIGLGKGRQRGKVTYTTAVGASFDITAARCAVVNLTFDGTGIDNVTNMVNVKTAGADCTIKDCEFLHANASGQAANVILTDATADRLRVEGCMFHGSTDAGTSSAISLVGGDSIVIKDCIFQGAYNVSGGVIKNATTDCTNLVITGCVIQNQTASNTKSIVLTATSTGQIANNRFQVLSGTAPITGAAMSWVGGNYYAATIATAGTLI